MSKLTKLPEVRAQTTLSKSSIYERIAAGTFPKQVSLGGRSVAWLQSEIEAWIVEQVAASRKARR